MIHFNFEKDCTGCKACADVCPKNCITFAENIVGFFMPKIEKSRCIECHRCEKVCPALNYSSNNLAGCKCYSAFLHVVLKVAGGWLPVEYLNKWNKIEGFEYLGFVEDLDALYEEALATVVPIEKGGGTCIKPLESLSHSRVCLTTPFGARGLTNCDKIGIVIYQTAEEFINGFNDHVLDSIRRTKDEVNGRRFVNENYSIEAFANSVSKEIAKLNL